MAWFNENQNLNAIKNNPIAFKWMNSNKLSDNYKKFIFEMSENEINKYFSDTKMTFGTAGIRSTVGPGTNQMNLFTYQQMSEGVAKWLLSLQKEEITVIVGHDTRKNADYYAMVVAKVLSSFGIKVFLYKDNQFKATPIVSFSIKETNADAAIVVTASHNPKNYLGFKVYNSTGGQILDQEAQTIVDNMPDNINILDNTYQENKDLINYFDDSIVESYFNACCKCLIHTNVYESKLFPVVFTGHHGTSCYDLPYLLKSLGYDNVVSVVQQNKPDPNFTYSPSFNPEEKNSFALALKYAQKTNANIMLGLDPDADRLAVVVKHKNKWHYLTGNQMGIIFTHYGLTQKQFEKTPFVVSTYVSTNYIDKIAKEFNANVYRTPTGFKWMGAKMSQHIQNEDFVVAFEEAIGSLNSDIGLDKDGFQAAALVLEIYDILQQDDKTLIDYLYSIYEEFGYWKGETVSYRIESLNWKEEMQTKFEQFKKFKQKEKVKDILGLQIKQITWNEDAKALEWHLQNDMWIKFRLSGTEPKFKIYFEIYGNSLEDCDAWLTALKNEFEILMHS
ncbi:MAG: phospho-sugar mutase [Malacoplasma sp.]|nr:phospho-sugar mutase [Malacoplasma sp.]